MLQRVHAQAGGQHQHQDDEHRGQQLLPLAGHHLGDDVEGVVVGVDAEQAEDTHYPEHPEGHRPGGEEEGQAVGQKGEQVHQAAEGQGVGEHGPGLRQLGVEAPGRPQPQAVVHGEKDHGDVLQGEQSPAPAGADLGEGIQDAGRQVENDSQRVQDIVEAAGPVLVVAHLDDLADPSPAGQP